MPLLSGRLASVVILGVVVTLLLEFSCIESPGVAVPVWMMMFV